ncbi:MAG TPA: SCO family protein [Candidatus Acidoferrales bacterium]|nr:SCO family protein [Candidatus Acidoferrales bacterium]
MRYFAISQSVHRSGLATAVLVLAIAIAACGNREAVGDYPAANRNDGLPDVGLVDQRGVVFSLASLKGKLVLIDFIYTSCASTCPLLTAKMVQVAHELGPALGADVRIVSITLDPEHDTPCRASQVREDAGCRG